MVMAKLRKINSYFYVALLQSLVHVQVYCQDLIVFVGAGSSASPGDEMVCHRDKGAVHEETDQVYIFCQRQPIEAGDLRTYLQ